MTEIEFKTYQTLLDSHCISESKISKYVKRSDHYQQLLDNGVLVKMKKGRGFNICIKKFDEFHKFFKYSFPSGDINTTTRADNIRKLRNSKAIKIDREPVFFFRGFNSIIMNCVKFNAKEATYNFGLFACKKPVISVNKICFVENLDTFLEAEKLFGKNYLYIHKYGRIGVKYLKNITAKTEVLVFSDYDYVGLNEFLTIKEIYPNAKFYIPPNYDNLFKKYSTPLKDGQAPSKKLNQCQISTIVKIREQVKKTTQFLEQEFLI